MIVKFILIRANIILQQFNIQVLRWIFINYNCLRKSDLKTELVSYTLIAGKNKFIEILGSTTHFFETQNLVYMTKYWVSNNEKWVVKPQSLGEPTFNRITEKMLK